MYTGNPYPTRVLGDIGNKNAAVGEVGEYVQNTRAQGAAIALATGVVQNIVQFSLSAGDWDLAGVVDFLFAGTTSYTALTAAISLNGTVLPLQVGTTTLDGSVLAPDPLNSIIAPATVPGAGTYTLGVGPLRFTVAGPISPFPVALVAQATFTVAALSVFGTLRARRVQ